MSWRDRSDLGLELVGHVHDALKIEDNWLIDTGRGIRWWADDFGQSIWTDPGMFHNAQNVFRIHAEIDLLKGRGHAQDFELALASAMRDATLSAIVFDQDSDTYKLHSSVYAHNENSEWLGRLLMAVCALQVAEAHEIGHHLAQEVKAIPATSGHPIHGIRSTPNAMVKAVEMFFKGPGDQPSKWIDAPEWRQMEWAMERQAMSFSCDHHSELRAEFYWPILDAEGNRQVSVLHVTTADSNPHLGNGLMLRLMLPMKLSPARCAHTALMLNSMERKEWLRCHLMGSWCNDNGALEFECFVPNTSYDPNLLENLSLSMAIRAQWSAEVFEKWYAEANAAKV